MSRATPTGQGASPGAPVGRGAWWLAATLGVASLALLSLWLRPLWPVDETRYLSVAWEMWRDGQFLVPRLDGALYDHKPPLLFWLVHLGWWIGGVGEAWPRLVSPLAALAALALLARLGERLWPGAPGSGRLGSLLFLSGWAIAFYVTALMFDMLLLACLAGAWLALLEAVRGGRRAAWCAFGLALGLGLLSKGPVALVYTLPLLFTRAAWKPARAPPVPRGALWQALLLALLVPGTWLALAAGQGDGDYFGRLLSDQTLHRITGEMGHARPGYWYLPLLVLMALPWPLWPPAWRAMGDVLRAVRGGDRGLRFLAIGSLVPLVLLSLAGGKQAHYLFPVLALAALALARGLALSPRPAFRGHGLLVALLVSPLPLLGLATLGVFDAREGREALFAFPLWLLPLLALLAPAVLWLGRGPAARVAWRLALCSLAFGALAIAVVFPAASPYYRLQAASAHVGEQQALGRPVVFVGNYHGEFGFLGRLRQPVRQLSAAEANAWLPAHPEALVVVRADRVRHGAPLVPEFSQRYKSDALEMYRAADLVASGSVLLD